ncbi:uncharacterized protein PG998_011360 [Apiospora kogelbergensis]|uniref:uncharacterized protein n=1 Tax=Apiospora kogelbergensis TaxID=1337665 RepID=UPI00312DA281
MNKPTAGRALRGAHFNELEVDKVYVSLAFLRDLKIYEVEKPYHLTLNKDREADAVITNIAHDVYENIEAMNIRGNEGALHLDIHGSELAKHKTSMNTKDFGKPDAAEKYAAEIRSFLADYLGARDVRLMHYKVRNRDLSTGQDLKKDNGTRGRPIPGVHIDASAEGALRRIQLQWPSQVEELVKGRFQILNIWRPLTSSLKHWPMAFCDVRSIDPGDLVLADQISPGFQGENTLLYFNPRHRFHYVSDQSQDEVWIFKQYDSLMGVAGGCPHTSFHLEAESTTHTADQSVEVAIGPYLIRGS